MRACISWSMRVVMALLLVVLPRHVLAAPPPWATLPSDPEAAWAVWEQDRLPALEARKQAAEARLAAAERYFAGEAPLAGAFPELQDLRLNDPTVLAAMRLRLDDAAVARAEERLLRPDALGDPQRVSAGALAVAQALDAEDRAAEAERRLLIALSARLTRWPAETAVALDRHVAPLRSRAAALSERVSADNTDVDAARELGQVQEELARWLALERELSRRATVPDASDFAVEADLAQLADGGIEAAWQADARLSVVRPHLSGETAEAVDTARARFRKERVLPALEEGAAAPPTAAPRADRTEAELVAALDALVVPTRTEDDTLSAEASADQARIDDLRIQAIEARRTQLRAALADVRRATSSVSEGDEARLSRQDALAQAQQAESERLAELLTHVAAANERAALAHDRVANLERWGGTTADARLQRLQKLDDLVVEALDSAATILYASGAEPDTAYEAARSEIQTLRQEALHHMLIQRHAEAAAAEADAQIEADRALLAEFSEEARAAQDRTTREEALSRWRTALFDQIDAVERRGTVAMDQSEAVLVDLRHVKSAKRSLSSLVTPEQRRLDWQELIDDLRWERALVWPAFLAIVSDQFRAVSTAPLKLFNPVYVAAFVRSGFWLFALMLGWYVVRARSQRIANGMLTRLVNRSPGRASLFTLQPEVTRAVQAVLDLLIGWLLREPLVAFLPIAGFAVWVYLQVAMYRLLVAVFDLVVEPYGAVRPSLVALGPKAHKLARHSLRWLALWIISRDFVRQILQGVLDADGLDTVTRVAIDTVGVVGCLWLLHRWAPVLRAEIAGFHQGSRWVRFLSRPPAFRALNAPWALVTGIYLALAWVWDRTQELARQREGFGRLLATVTRYRLPNETDAPVSTEPLPKELLATLHDRARHYSEYVERPADALVRKAFTAWRADHLSGLVVLTGEPGEGKDDYLARIVPTLDSELTVLSLKVERRLLDEDSAVRWLGSALGADDHVNTIDGLVEWMEAMPPHVIVVSDIQRAFLRSVGGFQGLRAMLYMLNAVSTRHFVVASCHRKALQYMRRLGSLVNMEVVRQVVDLSPYGERDLQALIGAKLEECGYTVRYDDLVQKSPFGVAPEIELRRAVGRFYLLLSDASDGNPGVAMRLLVQCLTVGSEPRTLHAHIAPCLGTGTLENLSDDEMFTLVALRTQGSLDEPELVRVTNMSATIVRNVVRNMVNRRLLVREGPLVKVAIDQLPVVTRTLRRRHFLHFAG